MIEASIYEIKRFDIPGYELRGKKYLSRGEELKFFNRPVYIEEKVDGKNTSFLYPENENIIILAEDVAETHTIFYKNLPARFLVFDIVHNKEFLTPFEKLNECLKLGLIPVPIIYHGKITDKNVLKDMVKLHVSAFETEINPKIKEVLIKKYNDKYVEKLMRRDFIEGIVIKFYDKGKLYAGKVVDPFFEEIIDEAGRYENYPNENIIKPWDIEKYSQYIQRNYEKVGKYISDDDLEEGYEIYISNFDYWKKPNIF